MKVLVCGGRDYTDQRKVNVVLDNLHKVTPITLVIHGAYRGADTCANNWALSRGIPVKSFKANWTEYGRAAGPLRNTEMIQEKPDLIVSFDGGDGTADMVEQAYANSVKVYQVEA